MRFWELLGFERVEPPHGARASSPGSNAEGTQIHLMPTEAPTVPSQGHVAVVAPDFEAAVAGSRTPASRSIAGANTGAPRAPKPSRPAATSSS